MEPHVNRVRTLALSLILGTSLIFTQAAMLRAQAQPTDSGEPVAEVRVVGNEHMSEQAVLSYVKTRPEGFYEPSIVADDVQRLLASGRFDSAQASIAQTASGIIVTFEVRERPVVAAVLFEGNKSIAFVKLRKQVTLQVGDPLDPFKVAAGRDVVIEQYHKAGYPDVQVTVDEKQISEQRRVVYKIQEGQRVFLRHINIEGNKQFGWLRLALQVRSSVGLWFFNWPLLAGKVDSEKIADDVQRLRQYHIAAGFLEAEVDRLLNYSSDHRRATLTFIIREGPALPRGQGPL